MCFLSLTIVLHTKPQLHSGLPSPFLGVGWEMESKKSTQSVTVVSLGNGVDELKYIFLSLLKIVFLHPDSSSKISEVPLPRPVRSG